ncbi:hypothetical protein AGLY_005793 [Aphis glycines]|uniref:Uncharacterized protein n=1 Tax=Aphis glycines TaxID=307491 RepID=A0A6G0TRV9_APHGL|nr:hypothetical protein AGLY_005793 [Aphis glycines]
MQLNTILVINVRIFFKKKKKSFILECFAVFGFFKKNVTRTEDENLSLATFISDYKKKKNNSLFLTANAALPMKYFSTHIIIYYTYYQYFYGTNIFMHDFRVHKGIRETLILINTTQYDILYERREITIHVGFHYRQQFGNVHYVKIALADYIFLNYIVLYPQSKSLPKQNKQKLTPPFY